MTTEDKLQILREKLLVSDDFQDTMLYFCDYLANDAVLLRESKHTRNNALEAVIETIGERYSGGATLHRLFFVELEAHAFVYGTFLLNKKMGQAIYFRELDRGLLMLPNFFDDSDVHYFRFSVFAYIGDPNRPQ